MTKTKYVSVSWNFPESFWSITKTKPFDYSSFVLKACECCSHLLPFCSPTLSLLGVAGSPHFGHVYVREHDIWGGERGWGKHCTTAQHCGYSVKTCANFSGFIRLFTKKGYGQRKMRTLLKLIVWALCKSEILWKKITKSCVLKSTKQWESIYSIN